MKCQCASSLGMNIGTLDWEEFNAVNSDNSNFLYQNSNVESVQIGNLIIVTKGNVLLISFI